MPSDPLQLSLLVGVPSLLAGYLLAKLAGLFSNRLMTDREDPRNHRIRALEADLRLAERQAQDQGTETSDTQAQLEDAMAEGGELRAALQEANAEIRKLKEDLKISCAKTIELRHELTDRAEQTIRGQVQLEDLKTELQVAKAGSDAVLDEINRLNEEREELSDTVAGLKKLVSEE